MEGILIQQGFSLLLYGMGTVFIFLTLLIFTTLVMSAVVTKYFPEAAPAPSSKSAALASVPPLTQKVIMAALAQHRRQ